ncbi:MAG: ATP12 family protein [Rhizomicrobium sp.]
MKRFYKQVGVRQVGPHFGITLDERPVKTPNGDILALRSAALADAIAAEWARQGDQIDQRDMPLTGFANTAIDHVRADRATVLRRLADFARHDLVCYRASEPPELAAREAAAWDAPLAWAQARYDIELEVTRGIAAIPQPSAALDGLARHLATRDEFALTALVAAAGNLKSVVLALSLADGRLAAAAAHAAAHIDEDFQAEKWGRDAEAVERQANLLAELDACEQFLRLAAA